MKKNETSKPSKEADSQNEDNAEGYPLYPPSEDIYSKFREVKEIDPEEIIEYNGTIIIPDIHEADSSEVDEIRINEIDQDELDALDDELPGEFDIIETEESEDDEVKELGDHIMGTDLDIPGADLDDEGEELGNEDEENNYYSIGGDRHHDLEEGEEE